MHFLFFLFFHSPLISFISILSALSLLCVLFDSAFTWLFFFFFFVLCLCCVSATCQKCGLLSEAFAHFDASILDPSSPKTSTRSHQQRRHRRQLSQRSSGGLGTGASGSSASSGLGDRNHHHRRNVLSSSGNIEDLHLNPGDSEALLKAEGDERRQDKRSVDSKHDENHRYGVPLFPPKLFFKDMTKKKNWKPRAKALTKYFRKLVSNPHILKNNMFHDFINLPKSLRPTLKEIARNLVKFHFFATSFCLFLFVFAFVCLCGHAI